MKKIAYTQPEAEMVLLLEDDVIRTSSLTTLDAGSIGDVPTASWKTQS